MCGTLEEGVFGRVLSPIVKYIKRKKPGREERPRMSENTLSPVPTEAFRNNLG
jgi:hypothetical protein